MPCSRRSAPSRSNCRNATIAATTMASTSEGAQDAGFFHWSSFGWLSERVRRAPATRARSGATLARRARGWRRRRRRAAPPAAAATAGAARRGARSWAEIDASTRPTTADSGSDSTTGQRPTRDADDDALGQHDAQHEAAAGAERAHHAELARALGRRHRQRRGQAQQADHGHQQRDEAERHDEDRDVSALRRGEALRGDRAAHDEAVPRECLRDRC